MRICLVYDRFHPLTLGGAERWHRDLGEALIAAGHDVTFLTLRHWDRATRAAVPGGRVVTMGPKMEAYNGARRTMLPPLVFGACVLWHLLRHGRSPGTPFALIENGSRPEQRVVSGPLEQLPQLALEHGVRSPALLIVGEVAGLAPRLHWFGQHLGVPELAA